MSFGPVKSTVRQEGLPAVYKGFAAPFFFQGVYKVTFSRFFIFIVHLANLRLSLQSVIFAVQSGTQKLLSRNDVAAQAFSGAVAGGVNAFVVQISCAFFWSV